MLKLVVHRVATMF